MLDLVVVDGRARGIVTRDLVTGEIESHVGRRGGAGDRRLRQRLLPRRPTPRAATPPRSGAPTRRAPRFANPCYTQIHPTCIPVTGDYQSKLTLMCESLRNDGRIWVPKQAGRHPAARPRSPRTSATTTSSGKYPSFGNLAPRDIASRAAKQVCDEGRGVGPGRPRRLPRLRRRHRAAGRRRRSREKYGNLFEMYERITGEDPYEVPMRIYPAIHYTMGGLWVDYNLMSTIPGLFVLGEANFSDHGANRLGASALMQGLADGYFVLPYTIGNYLASAQAATKVDADHAEFEEARGRGRGAHAAAARHQGQAHGRLVPPRARASSCGTTAAWRATRQGLRDGARRRSRRCARSSGRTCSVPGSGDELNQSLEKAGRVADFLELGELMCRDALEREESCGGHFREEYQTAGRRGAARRRALLPRRGLGVHGRRPGARAGTRSRSSSRTSTCATRSYK